MKTDTLSLGKRITFMVGVIIMALAAGAAGAAIVANYVSGIATVPVAVSNVAPRPVAKSDATKVSAASRASAVFYKRHTGTAVLDKVFLPSDKVGAAAVLTADGWLVTSASVLTGRDQLIVVFSDKTTAAIDPAKAILDKATGLAYIKADAQHLPVVVFGDDTMLQASDPVYSVNVDSAAAVAVVAPRLLPVIVRSDYVESTELLARRLVLSGSGATGSPVVDGNGSMIGLDQGDGLAIPASYIADVLRSIFKDNKVVRPVVGIRYVSLDNLPNAKDAGLAVSGALVTGDGKYRAVEKGSAAEAAGLRESDVITMVERDRINNEETLAERLQDYVPGARVELTVMRAGEQVKVGLTLK